MPVFEVDPAVEAVAVQRIGELRATRDAARFDDAMGRFAEAAAEFARREVAQLGTTACSRPRSTRRAPRRRRAR